MDALSRYGANPRQLSVCQCFDIQRSYRLMLRACHMLHGFDHVAGLYIKAGRERARLADHHSQCWPVGLAASDY